MLQPIVENAILHGLVKKEKGTITISMWSKDGDGYIQVADDGDGIASDKLSELRMKIAGNKIDKGKGIGILNVNRRLKVHYGEDYGLTIKQSDEKGTIIVLKYHM